MLNKFICLLLCLSFMACQSKAKVDTNKAVAIMEQGQFEEAIEMLKPNLGLFSKDAKAYYATAVSLLRKDDPDIKKAIKYKKKAERLGYQIPDWFDNYVIKLNNDKV